MATKTLNCPACDTRIIVTTSSTVKTTICYACGSQITVDRTPARKKASRTGTRKKTAKKRATGPKKAQKEVGLLVPANQYERLEKDLQAATSILRRLVKDGLSIELPARVSSWTHNGLLSATAELSTHRRLLTARLASVHEDIRQLEEFLASTGTYLKTETLGRLISRTVGNLVQGREQLSTTRRNAESALAIANQMSVAIQSAAASVTSASEALSTALNRPAAAKWAENPDLSLKQLGLQRRSDKGAPMQDSGATKKRTPKSDAVGTTQSISRIDVLAKLIDVFRDDADLMLGATPVVLGPDVSGPVISGREHLIRAFEALEQDDSRGFRKELISASTCFSHGVTGPAIDEWPIDGPRFGQANAAMWYGITLTLRGQVPDRSWPPDTFDPQSLDSWFAVAIVIYLKLGHHVEAGRALQEWAEARRHSLSPSASRELYLVAAELFTTGKRPDRAATAVSRSTKKGTVQGHFFRREQPSERDRRVLSTVLGSLDAASIIAASRQKAPR